MPSTLPSDNSDYGSRPAVAEARTEAEKNYWHQTGKTLTDHEMRAVQPKGDWFSDMPSTLPSENPDYGSRPAMTEARTEAEKRYWYQTDNTLTGQEMRAVQPKGDCLSDMPSAFPSENPDYGLRPATTDAEKNHWYLTDNTQTSQEMRAVQPKGDWLSDMPSAFPSESPDYGSRPATTDAEKSYWHQTDNTQTSQEMRAIEPKGDWLSDMPSTLPSENPDYGSRPAMTEARTEAEKRYWHQTDNTLTGQEMQAVEPKGDWLSDMPSTLLLENPDYGSRPVTTDAENSYWHQADNLADNTLASQEMRAVESKGDWPATTDAEKSYWHQTDNTLTGQEMRAVQPKGGWLSDMSSTLRSENPDYGSRPLR